MKKNLVIVLTLIAMLSSLFCLTVSADTGAVTDGTSEVTGIWSNLGTSGIIGIAVAAVVLIAAIVLIVVLAPKKHSK